MLLATALVLAACGGDTPESPKAPSDPLEVGQQVYSTYCVTCHQADGRGVAGLYPPIAETEWVRGDVGRLIRLTLNGVTGPVLVNGDAYNNVMTPGAHLSDEQIAGVLTYVRQSFGNEAGPVQPGQVAAVRAAGEKVGLWLAEELEHRTGLPPQ
jgi:mono/diheme cytochrome c family protein